MTGVLTPDQFRSRFALATFDDGGVVVDVVSGSYSRLNRSAAMMLNALERAGSADAAAADVAARLHITPAAAAQSLRDLLAALDQPGVRTPPTEPLIYRHAGDQGYELWHRERRILHVDPSGRRVSLVCPLDALPLSVFDYVSDVAPRLMFLQGIPVLHGSSCRHGDHLLGLCGKSRAGKTTTARMFDKHGWPIVSEDLMILTLDRNAPAVFLKAEEKVRDWFGDASRRFASGATSVDTTPLARAAAGPTLPLKTLWFLDAQRRNTSFRLEPMLKPEGLALLLTHAFLGAAGSEAWRGHLANLFSIVSAASVYEAHLPDGLDNLARAVERYTTNSAS
jgi:hypothetical protein